MRQAAPPPPEHGKSAKMHLLRAKTGELGLKMAILYGIKTCDTCRKALKELAAKADVEFHDVRETPLAPAQIAQFHDAFGDKILNTRSTTWRGLSEADRAAPLIDLIKAHPTLMKRPVIEADGRYYLGWTKDVQDALIG